MDEKVTVEREGERAIDRIRKREKDNIVGVCVAELTQSINIHLHLCFGAKMNLPLKRLKHF